MQWVPIVANVKENVYFKAKDILNANGIMHKTKFSDRQSILGTRTPSTYTILVSEAAETQARALLKQINK